MDATQRAEAALFIALGELNRAMAPDSVEVVLTINEAGDGWIAAVRRRRSLHPLQKQDRPLMAYGSGPVEAITKLAARCTETR